jgi:DNA-binding response OmpR family regulator
MVKKKLLSTFVLSPTCKVSLAWGCVIYNDNERIPLTAQDLRVFTFLAESYPELCRTEILLRIYRGKKLWHKRRALHQSISKLRKKLGGHIVSVRGIGYKLVITGAETQKCEETMV